MVSAMLLLLTVFGLRSMMVSQGSAQVHLTATPPASFQFGGKWNCQGTFRGGKQHQAAFVGSMILDGKWIELSETDTVPSTGYSAKYLIGVDADQKRLIEFDANTFSAATYYSLEGWVGSVLTMTAPVSQNPQAPYALNRFLYTLVGQDSFTVDWQISKTKESQWTTADHLSCSRQP